MEKTLQNATKALKFTSHRQPENLWNPLVISYTLDLPIWFVFCITLSRNKTLISLACIFFSWKDAELFLFMPCIWNHNLRIYMVHNLQNVYGILANDGLTSFLKEHLIVLLTCVFTKHLVKEYLMKSGEQENKRNVPSERMKTTCSLQHLLWGSIKSYFLGYVIIKRGRKC